MQLAEVAGCILDLQLPLFSRGSRSDGEASESVSACPRSELSACARLIICFGTGRCARNERYASTRDIGIPQQVVSFSSMDVHVWPYFWVTPFGPAAPQSELSCTSPGNALTA